MFGVEGKVMTYQQILWLTLLWKSRKRVSDRRLNTQTRLNSLKASVFFCSRPVSRVFASS